ncbi:uncharacterized protein LOC143276958 isoform X2 [Babylonia areolata]
MGLLNGTGHAMGLLNGTGHAMGLLNGTGHAMGPLNGTGHAMGLLNGTGHAMGPLNDTGYLVKMLEDAEALEQLPVLVLLGLMSLVGDVGNGVALYVYYTRFTPSSTRSFILAMSVFDLLFCSVTLPGEILDLRFPLTYSARWLCRLHRLISVSLTLFSAMILVAVALDRRRKICFPFRPQLTARQVSLTVAGCIGAAVVIGFPFAVMNGHHTVKTEVEGVVGSACSVDDAFINTAFPLAYNGILLLIFLVCVVAMSVSYVQIARKIVRHKRKSVVGGGWLGGRGGSLPQGDADTQQSSSHYNTSDLDVGHHHRPGHSVSEMARQVLAEDCKRMQDDVFPDAGPAAAATNGPLPEAALTPTPSPEVKPLPRRARLWNVFRSRGAKRKEVEVGVGHAVSLDTLNSSHLFRKQVSQCSHRSRSLSVGDVSPALHKKNTSETSPLSPETSTTTAAASEKLHDVKINSDVKPTLTSPENDANETSQHAGKESDKSESKTKVESAGNETSENAQPKPGERTEDSPAKPGDTTQDARPKAVERSRSVKSVEGNHGEGITRNTALKSSVKSTNGSHDRHVTISESRPGRLQSVLHSTLSRLMSRNNSTGSDVAATSTLRRRHRGKKIPSRTTWMMFVLTAIFVISYLPYLTLVCVRATNKEIEVGLHGWQLNLYTLGLKSYFINSIVNPFVYSFCSARFRHQCRHLFQRRSKMSISD